MKILIVEDEKALNKNMVDYLSAQKFICETVENYHDALEKIDLYQYDCIVLDIMLPGGTGLDLLKQLKQDRKTDGVIIISARNELDDKIAGLGLGADDYLTKPFHLSELSARIMAIVRRKNMEGNNLMQFEEITISIQTNIVSINSVELVLTPKEYNLLLYFMSNKNRVLSKNAIVGHLYSDEMDAYGNYDFIYAHIKNLRKKLMQAGAADYIKSVYGMGYKFSL